MNVKLYIVTTYNQSQSFSTVSKIFLVKAKMFNQKSTQYWMTHGFDFCVPLKKLKLKKGFFALGKRKESTPMLDRFEWFPCKMDIQVFQNFKHLKMIYTFFLT